MTSRFDRNNFNNAGNKDQVQQPPLQPRLNSNIVQYNEMHYKSGNESRDAQ